MPDRTRPIRKEICLNEQELNLIQHKMRQLGTHNFGVYARKMLLDGYIIKVDYTEQKKLTAAVSRVTSNVNQICRRINSTGRCYEDDVAELRSGSCCWTGQAFPGRTATSSRTAPSGCTSPWSRRRQSSTAAARAPHESSGN